MVAARDRWAGEGTKTAEAEFVTEADESREVSWVKAWEYNDSSK